MDFEEIRWLFFDLSDTLLDEREAIRSRIRDIAAACSDRGHAVSVESLEAALAEAISCFAPGPFPHAVGFILQDSELVSEILRRAGPPTHLMRPFPEAGPLLRALSERYRLGIIANQTPGTAARLAGYGWERLFTIVLASAEAGVEKPDPAIFRLALEQAACAPEEAVMIGDRPDNDICPAKRLGWRTIRIRQGLHAPQDPRHPAEEPDATVAGLSELAAFFGITLG
jgi:FMN phosphatase YigB (HAD superfamily)